MRDNLIDILEGINHDLGGTLLHVNIPKYVDKILKFATIISISKKEKIIAFIAFYENDVDKNVAYLTMIAVCKDFWQNGYGKSLLEYSIYEITKKGFDKYRLEVKEDNLKAIKLYENYGFKSTEVVNGMIKMEKQL